MPSTGPISVSVGLLGIGARFGLVGSSVPVLVTVEPPAAVTVTLNENVADPGGIVTPLQVTIPPADVQAGLQPPANDVPPGSGSLTSAVNAAPGLLTASVYVSVSPVAASVDE